MLKSLRIDHTFSSRSEYSKLLAFLALLGLQPEGGKKKRNERSAVVSAPLGKVSLEWNKSDAPVGLWSFAVEVDDPDTAFELVRRKGYEIVSDFREDQTGNRHFVVQVAAKLRIAVFGTPSYWIAMKQPNSLRAGGGRFAIVVSRFNSFITERLLQGALHGLLQLGAKQKDIEIVHVPGAFEIPSAARTLAETKKYDAIVCIGCLLRGDTAHYDVIVNETARGVGQSAQETGVPHAFGVLTCETLEQAIDRAGLKMGNKGFEAALAAVEMANLKKTILSQSKSSARSSRRNNSRNNKR